MSTWEKFEINATKHLNEIYGHLATFEHEGGADSTTPDILVKTLTNKSFYIEAKLSNAQCGQFVLQPNLHTSTFVYTAKNRKNKYADKIIEFMNSDFEAFKEAGTAGKSIEMDSSVFVDWIKVTYSEKGVRWFISGNYVLIPISKFEEYFDVKATYRVKRSGSSDVGISKMKNVISEIQSLNLAKHIIDYIYEGSKLIVKATKDIDKKKFIYEGNEYIFSKRGSKYEVRKLSNTFNANVIFSVSLKNRADKYQEEFVSYLKS